MLSLASVKAQDFDGHWVGDLTVNVNGAESKFPFEMYIHTDGKGGCSGETTLFLNIDGKEYHALSSFYGTYNKGDDLEFIEYEIVESESPESADFYWCEKTGELYIKGDTLTGDVTGKSPKGDCLPAKAFLKLKTDSE